MKLPKDLQPNELDFFKSDLCVFYKRSLSEENKMLKKQKNKRKKQKHSNKTINQNIEEDCIIHNKLLNLELFSQKNKHISVKNINIEEASEDLLKLDYKQVNYKETMDDVVKFINHDYQILDESQMQFQVILPEDIPISVSEDVNTCLNF